MGWVVYNADDENAKDVAEKYSGKKLSYAIEADADLRAGEIKTDEDGVSYKLAAGGKYEGLEVKLGVSGEHRFRGGGVSSCAVRKNISF